MNANGGSQAADASPQIISFGEIVFDMIEGTPQLTVLGNGALVLLYGVQSIISPEMAEQINDVRPALNLGYRYRLGEINLAVSRTGNAEVWDEVGNVLTWPNTTGMGGLLAAGRNHSAPPFRDVSR